MTRWAEPLRTSAPGPPTPHAASASALAPFVERGIPVVDVSADFRLHDAAEYTAWYGGEHPAPHRLLSAVFGLPELHRAAIAASKLVANPGCYSTLAILALAPAWQAGGASAVGGVPVSAIPVACAALTTGSPFKGFIVRKERKEHGVVVEHFVAVLRPRCHPFTCPLYPSDAADDLPCVDFGGRRIINKKIRLLCFSSDCEPRRLARRAPVWLS